MPTPDVIDLDADDLTTVCAEPTPPPSFTTTPVEAAELRSPTPDAHVLFAHYNRKHFDGALNAVYVEFSSRMTLCAGTCTYRDGHCRIALSAPLLRLRPASDLKSTLLHEMVHAALFLRGVSRDGPDGHGPQFMTFAARINSSERGTGIRITAYHTFNDEVDHYRVHHWKCSRCSMLVKRAMNRPPAPRDPFWPKHVAQCGGDFVKISEPAKPLKARAGKRVVGVSGAAHRKEQATTGSVPQSQSDVIQTRRIDEMLASQSQHGHKQKPQAVHNSAPLARRNCPVCNVLVSVARMNEHLDQCLAGNFVDDNDLPPQPPTPDVSRRPHGDADADANVILVPSTPTPPSSPAAPVIIPSSPPRHAPPSALHPAANPSVALDTDGIPASPPLSSASASPTRDDVCDLPDKSLPLTAPTQRPPLSYVPPPRHHSPCSRRPRSVLVELATNPAACDSADINHEVDRLFTNEPPKHKQRDKDLALVDILGTDVENENDSDVSKTIIPRHCTFSQVARHLSTNPSTQANMYSRSLRILREQCSARSDGTGYNVPVSGGSAGAADVAQLVVQLSNGRRDSSGKRPKDATVEIAARPATVRGDRDKVHIPVPQQENEPIQRKRRKTDGHPNINGVNGVNGNGTGNTGGSAVRAVKDMGQCPICGRSVDKSALQTHVNSCLDSDDIRNEFASQPHTGHDRQSNGCGGGGESDCAQCPICDQRVPKSQLESHVEDCMITSGLDVAF